MIRRGGAGAGGPTNDTRSAPPKLPLEEMEEAKGPPPWRTVVLALVLVFCAIGLLPHRTAIPPLVQSDYAYMLIAADRLLAGQGLTSLQPIAPHQPWEYQYDWGFLTQWPMGYTLMVAGVRKLLGCGTIDACRWVSVLACSAALVGWFVWIRRWVPGGVTGILLSAAAAGTAVTTASLIDPSTDILLTAALPYVLLVSARSVELFRMVSSTGEADSRRRRALAFLVLSGIAAGGLFWIRYASVFVPLGIVCYLLLEAVWRRSIGLRHVGLFATAAALPVVLIICLNKLWSSDGSVQEQLNLGRQIGFNLRLSRIWEMWERFTDLGYHDYHWYSKWVIALWPLAIVTFGLFYRPARRALIAFAETPGVALCGLLVAFLLAMLLATTSLFSGKFDYIGCDRYYEPVRPLYFLFFVAPLLLVPRRIVRAALCAGLLIACFWTVQQDWSRPYRRWLAADREVTPYGQWAYCLSPGASELYQWLERQNDGSLIIFSNFQDYIALETGLPALPLPPDEAAIDRWIERICDHRKITQPRVLFVLDYDNRYRGYWLPEAEDVIQRFDLEPVSGAPPGISAHLMHYRHIQRPAGTSVGEEP